MSQLIGRLRMTDAGFPAEFSALTARHDERDPALTQTVVDIIAAVRNGGDRAVLDLTQQFDHHSAGTMSELEVSVPVMEEALASLDVSNREALEVAATRIRDYHLHQVAESWRFEDSFGNHLGQRVSAMERVGMYVPGGKASYPSSVLMNAIPAKVAGVSHICMVVPAPGGELNPLVLAAAAIAGVDRGADHWRRTGRRRLCLRHGICRTGGQNCRSR